MGAGVEEGRGVVLVDATEGEDGRHWLPYATSPGQDVGHTVGAK